MWPLEIIKRMNEAPREKFTVELLRKEKTRTPNGRLLSSTIEYTNEGIEILLVFNNGRRVRKTYPAIFSVTEAQNRVNELIHSIGV